MKGKIFQFTKMTITITGEKSFIIRFKSNILNCSDESLTLRKEI